MFWPSVFSLKKYIILTYRAFARQFFSTSLLNYNVKILVYNQDGSFGRSPYLVGYAFGRKNYLALKNNRQTQDEFYDLTQKKRRIQLMN